MVATSTWNPTHPITFQRRVKVVVARSTRTPCAGSRRSDPRPGGLCPSHSCSRFPAQPTWLNGLPSRPAPSRKAAAPSGWRKPSLKVGRGTARDRTHMFGSWCADRHHAGTSAAVVAFSLSHRHRTSCCGPTLPGRWAACHTCSPSPLSSASLLAATWRDTAHVHCMPRLDSQPYRQRQRPKPRALALGPVAKPWLEHSTSVRGCRLSAVEPRDPVGQVRSEQSAPIQCGTQVL